MASAKSQSQSTIWRQKGNKHYREVGEGLAPSLHASKLQDAMICYGHAISTATDNVERSSACKNMALAAWKMATVKDVKFYFMESMKHFQDAKESGKGRNSSWHDTLLTNSLNCWNDLREKIDERRSYKDRIRQLESFVPYLIDDLTKAQEYLEIADQYFHWSVTCLGARNYQEALRLLAETMFPLNEAQRFGRGDKRLARECEVRLEDVHVQKCVAESIQARTKGEQLLDHVLKEKEELNINMVWEIVDLFRQAALLTRGRDIELEAMALSALGKVYDKVLKLEDRARVCLRNAIELASSLVPRDFTSQEWFSFATDTLERYQMALVLTELEEEKRKKEEWMGVIKKDVKILEEKQKAMSKLDFLKYVYETYPPKIQKHTLGKVSAEPGFAELKKLYQKAVIHYHPDKVQESEHGAEWKVLSGEITKLLTSSYECFKGVEKPFQEDKKEEKRRKKRQEEQRKKEEEEELGEVFKECEEEFERQRKKREKSKSEGASCTIQ